MGFSIRPPMDSRLYVLNYDPQSGVEEMIFLYPLPKIPLVIFQKDRTYTFPGCIDPRAVSYPVDPPLGRMVFKVLGVEAGESSVDLVRGLKGTSGYYALHLKDLKDLIKRLRVLPGAAWWEESVEFWVNEK